MIDGFIDLRARSDAGYVSDNFWPSFTDIMMVVVMIFLITSTVLILRNWELVAELRATMEAERKAAEIARSATETSATLEEQLAQVQHQLSVLRMQLMQATEANQETSRRLSGRVRRVLELEAQLARVETTLQRERHQAEALSAQLMDAQERYTQLQGAYNKQDARLASTLKALSELRQSHEQQTAELGELRQQRSESQRQLADLRGDYDTLKFKYDELVKPARTAQGKHVVEVRYEKMADRDRISYKAPGVSAYRVVEREELEQLLDALKERYPRELYVKIVIPENSGLSYNEAWSFTKDILQSYDYYYQD